MKVDESLPVLVAGDPERNSEKLVTAQGGILYARQIVDDTVCEFYEFNVNVLLVLKVLCLINFCKKRIKK